MGSAGLGDAGASFSRAMKFVRELFSSGPNSNWELDRPDGGVGVREPRKPRPPVLSGAVALERPPDESGDVRVVGSGQG